MSNNLVAGTAGASACINDKGPTVAAVAPQANDQNPSPNSRCSARSGQALRVIEGEAKAATFLARLHASQADSEELAVIVSMLYGAALRGFCRVLAKALGVQHG